MGRAGIADPQQLTVLCKVLGDYCQRHGIGENSPERENLASKLLALNDLGFVTEDELANALDGDMDDRRQA